MKDVDRKLIFEAYQQITESMTSDQLADNLFKGVSAGQDVDQMLDMLGWNEMNPRDQDYFRNSVQQKLDDELSRTKAGTGGSILSMNSELSQRVMNSRMFSQYSDDRFSGDIDSIGQQAQDNMRSYEYEIVDALVNCSELDEAEVTQSVRSMIKLVKDTSADINIGEFINPEESIVNDQEISMVFGSLHHRDRGATSSQEGFGEFESFFKLTWKCMNPSMPYSFAGKIERNTREIPEYDPNNPTATPEYRKEPAGEISGVIRSERDVIEAVTELYRMIHKNQK